MAVDLIEVEPATLPGFFEDMREADKREVSTLCGLSEFDDPAINYLCRTALRSAYLRYAVMEGERLALWGIDTFRPVIWANPAIWFLSTPAIEDYPLSAARASRKYLEEILEVYPVVENYVDLRYTKAVLWLSWLGFEFGDVVCKGADKVPFQMVTKRK